MLAFFQGRLGLFVRDCIPLCHQPRRFSLVSPCGRHRHLPFDGALARESRRPRNGRCRFASAQGGCPDNAFPDGADSCRGVLVWTLALLPQA